MFGKSQHLLVNIRGVSKRLLEDTIYIKGFLDGLPVDIGMTLLKESKPEYIQTEDPEQEGVTGISLLYESHCSIHTFSNKGFALIDVFSCKPFDTGKVMRIIQDHFDPKEVWYKVVDRSILFKGTR